ncbi:MAG: DNA-processing protein DprA [Eubacterium sp.]|nr:DNA-processing protein DprA [Eubacterium sp.]MCM1216258.1 DNA-processing protein DprA [Lachnospiraceae bacterium]MCM1304939.1 DNA-processing protein DprA [Butyrivibrio sp.]MCM1343355.1 DNA-processing protein DprA [Muribaculaceae bacterium]MCM1238876.1 DNA-processing protein DprA [Lachnospiraceae bacterium]
MDRNDDILFLTPFEREYPANLRNIPDAPAGLYVRGRLPVETDITVAVIGARDCSDYGKYVAEGLGAFFGENGVTVVSGMARGIDGISQWAALEAGGTSIGVLGCGVDICYPAKNRRLFDRLLEQGAVFSEYPPGTPPRSMNFPARNRIVSGLADAVVVVEARNRSGTLITVDMALEQGREVYVVPGRITDRLSDGCNRLIKQGAGILLSPGELLEELRELKERTGHRKEPQEGPPGKKKKRRKAKEEQEEKWLKDRTAEVMPKLRDIYQALDLYPRSVEQIMTRLSPDVTQRQATIWLIQLCMENKAVQVSPGYFKIVQQ